MVKKAVIFGAGDFAREIIWVIEEINRGSEVETGKPVFQLLGLVDEDKSRDGTEVSGLPVYGELKAVSFWNKYVEGVAAICAVGWSGSREALITKAEKLGYGFEKVIHPEAVVSGYAELGSGVIVMPGTVITVGVIIGRQVLVNKLCSMGHDSVIGEYSTLAPGVMVGGRAVIEAGCDIGMNASVLPAVRIGEGSTVGAGAVVTSDLPAGCTAVGVPARPL